MSNSYLIQEHQPCIAHEIDGKKECGSSDALAIYQKEDEKGNSWFEAHCFSCKQNFTQENLSKSVLGPMLGLNEEGEVVEAKPFKKKPKGERITREQVTKLWEETQWASGGYRGIRDDINEFFGHRTKLDEDGNVVARYYPETANEGKIQGYKCRNHPKDFTHGKIGITGVTNELSGQHKFIHAHGNKVLIVGGEEDKSAAYQMLLDYQKKRNNDHFQPVAVVSPTAGEGSAANQIKNQYEWFDEFDLIYVGVDNDDAGREAAKAICEVLPKEKVRVVRWSDKDPNNMLQPKDKDGNLITDSREIEKSHKRFISDFYEAHEYVKSGIVGSSKLSEAIRNELRMVKVPLPPFMHDIQDLMAGGIPLGYIVNLIAATGVGKTSVINEMIYYWVFNSPHRVGIISLELDTGQYGLAMLSRHIGDKLVLYSDPEEAIAVADTPENLAKEKELFENEYGEDRFVLLDEQDGSLEELKRKIMQMILQYDCKFIVLDPLQDALDGYTNEEQAVFMRWMKQIVKRHKVTIFNVNHVRKAGTDSVDRFLTEDDVQGSSTIVKSAGANIIIMRDKLSEDPIMKNTTHVFIPKIRWTGLTGVGGRWYYDVKTHTMYELNNYFEVFPDRLPTGYDLSEATFGRKKGKDKPVKTREPEKDFEIVMDDGVKI